MLRIGKSASDRPQLRVGLGGNHYVYCKQRGPVEEIARALGRSIRGVYWRTKYGVWALRIRRREDKKKLKEMVADGRLI